MSCRIYLTYPPNILRRVREEIAKRWPRVDIGAPDIHQEMYDFASSFGAGKLPDLTVTAYPQMVLRAAALAKEGRLAAPSPDLPPLRAEYARRGMTPPVHELRIVAVVPGVLAASGALTRPLKDWGDLCASDFPGIVGCPPKDTPLPYLAEAVLRHETGDAVNNLLAKLDTASNPIDINKRLGRGELAAAFIIPAFARTFREGQARMVWPASGALAVPMLACLAAGAPPEAHEILAYLLSEEFQKGALADAAIAPVRPGVPGFAELEENAWNLCWPGWDLMLRVAETMLAA